MSKNSAVATAASRSWKGIASSVLADFGVVVDGRGLARIPYRSCDGTVLRERIEAPDGRRWWGQGEGLHLLGLDRLATYSVCEPLVLCEGESDTLTAVEHGLQALGVPGAYAFRPEWRSLLEPFARIYAVGDGDGAGREFAWAIRGAVPWSKPVACPTGTDLRELLQSGCDVEIERLFLDANRLARVDFVLANAATWTDAHALWNDDYITDDTIAHAWAAMCRARIAR